MNRSDPTTADVLRRATAGERITLEDVQRLTKAGRADLVNAAHRDDRIDTQARPINR